MSGGEGHSLPRTLRASLPREMKGIGGDYTGISLFIFLTKYKGLFEGVQKTGRRTELQQVPAFTSEELTSEPA